MDAVLGVWRQVPCEVAHFRYQDGGDTLTVRLPRPTPEALASLGKQLRAAQADVLSSTPAGDRIDRISTAVSPWLDPTSPERQLAERWLPVMTGYAPTMVHRGLTRYLRTFLPDALMRFLAQDLSDPAMLDRPVPDRAGGWSLAVGPRVLGQIVAGNIPGIALWHMVLGLLIKSAVITRVSRQEPLMAALMLQVVERQDPPLAELLPVAYWPSGDAGCEHAFFQAVDRLVAYGNDATIRDIAARASGLVPVVGYGHRVSLAVVGREALQPLTIEDAVRRAGHDIILWDQASCASPHAVLVERGGFYPPEEFAARLAAELQRWDVKEPLAPVSAEVAQGIRDWADAWEWEAGMTVRHAPDYRWVMAYGAPNTIPLSHSNRTVLVIPLDSLEEAVGWFERLAPHVQTVGVAVARRRLFPLLSAWARVGVTRVAELGRMHEFPAGWLHDGGHSIADLVTFMGVDPGVLEAMDVWDAETW